MAVECFLFRSIVSADEIDAMFAAGLHPADIVLPHCCSHTASYTDEAGSRVIRERVWQAMEVANLDWQSNAYADDFEFRVQEYVQDDGYDWHTDYHAVVFPNRRLSAVMLLSDPGEFVGGELELDEVGIIDFQNIGDIVVFASPTRHRVLPVRSGVRRSAVAWRSEFAVEPVAPTLIPAWMR